MLEKALYIVPTPIGNLLDITKRAIEVLQQVDVIAAEDTRHSKVLLDNLGITQKKLIACHDHNEEQKAELFVNLLQEGKSIALISDAGTPLISDPGFKVVRYLANQNFKVIALPGPCAAITALSVSALATDSFHFMGFLPVKEQELHKTLASLIDKDCVTIFYESPRRILATVEAIAKLMPERELVICRELTKTFESVYRYDAKTMYEFLKADDMRQKGEFVLIVDKCQSKTQVLNTKILTSLQLLQEKMSLKDACKIASVIFDINKNLLYKEALALKDKAKVDA